MAVAIASVWPWTTGCSPSTGWAAGSARSCATRWTCSLVLGLSLALRRVPRVRARGRLPLRRRPARRIGVGIYLVWPSFFTNVTDSYRLCRAGRLRTDLGGLYFNLVFMLALAGIYVATSAEVLLLVIAVTHLEMLEQLLPFVRFDGYFILSDLVGVPGPVRPRPAHPESALPGGPPRPARHGPAPRRPDRGDRLGAVRHPAADVHPRLPAAAPARDQPGAVALRQLQAHLTAAAVAGHHYAIGRRRRDRRRPGRPVAGAARSIS